jgi:hypothetical protein
MIILQVIFSQYRASSGIAMAIYCGTITSPHTSEEEGRGTDLWQTTRLARRVTEQSSDYAAFWCREPVDVVRAGFSGVLAGI